MKLPVVKIMPPPYSDGNLVAGYGTKVLDPEGNEIRGISRIQVDFTIDNFVTATIDLGINMNQPFDAIALISEQSLADWADFYGYKLEKKE